MPPRLLLANLLCEEELAPRRRTPSRGTVAKVSGLGTLLRVFAREGDWLWTPAAVAAERVPPVPGLPGLGMPVLVSGEVKPAGEVLAWGETPRSASLRALPRESRETSVSLSSPLHEVLWRLPVPAPATAAAVQHRAFHLQVARELGCALPGARVVASLPELERILAVPGAPAAWVVKAPLSAAGRSRYIERAGPALVDPKARRTVERLFEAHGPLLFEPWMERTADYGAAALLTGSELRLVGFHRQVVDARGQFAGIDLPATPPEGPQGMAEIVEGVGRALRRAGYLGPFGIDAWEHRTADGRTAFHPLGEINARLTFGLVVWALAERLGMERLRLRFGAGPPPGSLPLLLAGDGGGAAWLEGGP